MNPAVLWFSKFVAGVVRDRLRGDVNRNLQYAVGLFEAERLYGLNYVVVPSNDYSVHHDDKTYIDSVSFPHQTFFYRGGDCSDLAILYSALLESVGIEAAFITIPGHIFAAFSLGISEAEAKAEFYDPGMLIYRDGRAWAPVEITMVKDGFTKAWRVGAKEWYDNVRLGTAAFYPVREAWKSYPPAAFPDVNPRFSLPDEVLTMQSFDLSLDRYVAREIEPRIKETRARLAAGDPRIMANELGILYGRYGMLKESWAQFSAAAKGDFQSAWTNLGNVAYLRKDYKLAVGYYQWALKLDSEDHNALLGIARSQYELELFDESDRAYAELLAKDPELARRNGYLASIYGGEGRAWSLSDRFAGTAWAVPRERPAMALAPASVASPAPAAPAPPAPPSVVASEPVPGTALQGETMAKAQEEARPEGAVPAIGELPGPDAQVSPPPPLVLARPSPAKDAAEAAPQIAEALPEDADILAKLAASNAAKQEAEKAILAASVGPSPQAPPPVASPAESEDPIIVAVAPQPEAPAAQVEASAPQLEAPAAQVEASAPQLEAPAAQVEAPAAQVEAPAAQVEAPAAQLEGPAAQVEAPAAQVKAPAAQVEAPAAQLEAPAAQVEAPAAQVKAPAAQVEAPAAQVEAPAPQLEAPAPQPEAPAVQLEAQAPPAETSLPPVLTTATESYASLAEGFGSSFIGSGRWTVDPSTARQTDPDQFRAKLVLPLAQGQGSFRYSFSARSMGKGWVGLGLHIYAAGSKTHSGYGSGESILVWLTRDPVHFAKDTTRIQVYRSTTDVRMSLVAESPVELSIFELNRIEVEFDSNAGGVSVRVNGKEGLSTKLRGPIAEGAYVILRCIDKAEFADFRVESKR